MVINMKIKKRDEYDKICDELKKRSLAIAALDEVCGELMEKRDDLFSEIILENKLLRGNWKLQLDVIPTIILTTDKLKKENDLLDLIRVGRSLKDGNRIHIRTDEDFDITMIGSSIYWRLEICLLYIDDIDKLLEFFKEQGIKLQYNIFEFRIDAMKKQIEFLERLEK